MPKKANGYSNLERLNKKDRLRKEGEERNTAWRKLTPMQQIGVLNSKPGKSARQRDKILTIIRETVGVALKNFDSASLD